MVRDRLRVALLAAAFALAEGLIVLCGGLRFGIAHLVNGVLAVAAIAAVEVALRRGRPREPGGAP